MNPTNDIHDIKGVVAVPLDWRWVWLAVAVAVVALGVWLYWWWVKKLRSKPLPVTERVLSPFEIAIAALAQLRDADLPVEAFYTRLTDIVRRYLEDQLGLRAPERTTEEFLYELSQGSRLSAEHKELLATFLQEADLVKFARHRPGRGDMERAFTAAERFVREAAGRASLPASHAVPPAARQEPRPPETIVSQ